MNKLSNHSLLDMHTVNKLYDQLESQPLEESSKQLIDELKQELFPYIQSQQDMIYALRHVMSIMLVDNNGMIKSTDDYFCSLANYEKNEVMDKDFTYFLSRPTNDSIFSYWNNRHDSEVFDEELCYVTKTNTLFWMRTIIVPTDEGSSIIFGMDVTNQKYEETRQLEQAHEDYSRTVQSLVNLVFKVVRNKEGVFSYSMFEGKLAKDIGLTTMVVRSRKLEDIFGEKQSAFYKDKYTRGFNGEVLSYKHRYKDRYFYTTLSPIFAHNEVVEVIGSSIEITSYEEAEHRIQHMASHDPLTDLPNRSKLQKDLSNLIERNPKVSILFCNLDRFKYVNDAMGYMGGDKVIKIMADRIQSVLSPEDLLYRLGGDEFMICLPNGQSSEEIAVIGQEVLQKIMQPIHLMDKQIFITARIGAARHPVDSSSSDELISFANLAMQSCKHNGRHNFLFYTPNMNQYHDHQISIEGDLREAITRNELQLYYQPKVNVETGYISGMEALVRWNHPEKGFISPGEFIPIAEETGLITQLDEWVLNEACRQNQQWMEAGYAAERVAVNVSANEIQRTDFAEKVNRVLQETCLDPQFLEIEVTENSVMQNTDQCIRTMQDLKTLGVSLSIDDFGTGYSSLSYLRKFPIHYLKIDQTFIKGVLHDPSDSEIVKVMIQLADAFKLEVVAEGVENAEVLQFLQENHCAYYQGYYFSKPLPPEEMEKLLTKKQTYS
ncbi:EAL domain-containing protein [Halobacillus locisalis]|uniref:EAL domain-containing protein n=1 Tax=Halobacillus locisalis TaxID=220753 RepID=A0A838CX04_9BACI|nr:bifunctional diguanylate cyclase/phosphodiesterase [Halobacillus locisalis]MBA2176441.1 EAL domain-containing protein [Halobacillus locisalis]